jgi:5'-deoxynucleotidase YfbR-like HD superfamily hydrolase
MINYYNPELRDLQHVKRWAIVPTIFKQSVAEHSFFVALYVQELCAVTGTPLNVEVIQHALNHDMAEIRSGDIASPYKEENNIKDSDEFVSHIPLSVSRRIIVKCADLIEASLFIMNEEKFGNPNVAGIREDLKQKLANVVGEWRALQNAVADILQRHALYEGRVR